MAKQTKQIGSVAVDSQTGLEHYNMPKQHVKAAKVQAASPMPGGITPGYGKRKTGETRNIAEVPAEFRKLFEHDPSEIVLLQAVKHSIGNIIIFTLTIIVIFALLIGTGLMLADSSFLDRSNFSSGSRALGTAVVLFLTVIIAAIGFAATVVYGKSRLILTNQKLVFIRYHSLFSREISQLNISEVQDVNVAQHSIWDRIFKMGSITVETAGEQNNYVFTHVADPHTFARLTIQAHEGFVAEYGNK